MSHFRINGVMVLTLSIPGLREVLIATGRLPAKPKTIFVAEAHKAESLKRALDELEAAWRSTVQGQRELPPEAAE